MTATQIRTYQGPAPTSAAVAAQAGGGTFAAGAQFWKLTALGWWGESAPSNEATESVALNGSANLTWTLPTGATGVKVYRGTTTNAENALVATLGPVSAWTDTGGAGSAATPPASGAWTGVTKTGALPAKSNVPGGTNPGRGNMLMQGLMSWCAGVGSAAGGTGPLATIGRKEAAAAGWNVQDV